MYGSTWDSGSKYGYNDIETSVDGTSLRWGFAQKVYGILSVQLMLTMAVAGVVYYTDSIRQFALGTPVLPLVLGICPLILLCALSVYRHAHPTNVILLGLLTVTTALTVGLACAFTPGGIVVEALVLTAGAMVALTAFTYWAGRQGFDFSFLGPFLFVAVTILLLWTFIQVFFPLGQSGCVVFSLLATLIFSAYIIYDTDNLLNHYNMDEYIWASVAIYIDVVNLFLNLLNLMRGRAGGGD